MLKRLAVLLLLSLTACGGSTQVDVIYMTPDELHTTFGRQYSGYSRWDEFGCKIYTFYPEMYEFESAYTFVLGHELRHCLEGNYHREENGKP